MFLQNQGYVEQLNASLGSVSNFMSWKCCARVLVRFRHKKNTWLGYGKHRDLL